MANLERIYTIPLGDAYEYVRTKRARRAVKIVREFALRHMKAGEARISEGANSLIFRDGMQKPPRRIKVRMVKGDDAIARVWLVGEEEKIKELADKKKKEQESKKKEQEKKEEKKEAPKAAAAEKTAEPAKSGGAAAPPAVASLRSATPPAPQAAKPLPQIPQAVPVPKPAASAPARPAPTAQSPVKK